MKNVARFCFLLAIIITVCSLYQPYAPRDGYVFAASGHIQNSARAAILVDVTEGRVIFAQNENARLPMASTTKIMTAIVALEEAELDYEITVPKTAVGVEGSSIYLYEGEKITLKDLLYGLMLESGNDAATAIAIAIGGTYDRFVMLMNEKAKQLGLTNTNYENPHGLPNENHYTSALDLARLTHYALDNQVFAQIVATKRYETTDKKRLFVNHNRLLFSYDGMIGVKTGYTKAAGRCLVTASRKNGKTLVAVTLDDYYCSADHVRMHDYGYNN